MSPRTIDSVLFLRGIACGALAMTVATGALAQTASYLRVEPVVGGEPRIVVVEVQAATGVEVEVPARLDEATWLYGLGDFGSHNYSAATTAQERAGLRPSELLENSPLVMFGVDLGERVVVMSAEEFGLLAARAGMAWVGGDDAGDVRVRRIEGSKALVRSGAGGERAAEASSVASTKRGERAEIRPLFDPTVFKGESVFPVRVYVEGDGAAGVEVIATHIETGASQRVTADGKGIANLTIDAAGAWRVEFHRVRAAQAGDREAEWVVYSATLSFEVLGGGR